MRPDPVIQRVRAIRHAISAHVEHDPVKLIEYYLRRQQQQESSSETEPILVEDKEK